MAQEQCRVRLTFAGRVFSYRAGRQAADLYAQDVGAWLGVPVVVDDGACDDLPPLPCESLWS
ncbi:hypothetical protein AB0H71_03170 [Nocardia sp. NPDC050697]|uniref:hypothetical protein n=1 Tax=Nocardia sp. NPDC050697 TaxID=3155158 RepID=UPI00340D83E3